MTKIGEPPSHLSNKMWVLSCSLTAMFLLLSLLLHLLLVRLLISKFELFAKADFLTTGIPFKSAHQRSGVQHHEIECS